jgi:hypothetical protein
MSINSTSSTRDVLRHVLVAGTLALAGAGLITGCAGAPGTSGASADDQPEATHVTDLSEVPAGQGSATVCEGERRHIGIVVMRSQSDLALARAVTPAIVAQAEDLALRSCGSLSIGIAADQPEATEMHLITMVPAKLHAHDAGPIRKRMAKSATPQLDRFILDPVKTMTASPESPFLSVAARVREDLANRDIPMNLLVIVGDGVVVERANGIDARSGTLPQGKLDAFVARLHDVPCTVLVGAATHSGLHDRLLRRADKALQGVWQRAGSRLITTPAAQIPKCDTEPGS